MQLPRSNILIVHCLALVSFSTALFLPIMGRGFILDDFGHLYVAANESVWYGLTHASGGPYYAPLAWLSFKIDWILWGARAYPWASTNLLIHVINTLLLYFLALQLWRSLISAWWTAFGFALLFPANTSAVMFISTRAHLIATLFYVAAMLSTVGFVRTARYKVAAAVGIVTFAALAMFAKETGITVVAAVAIVIFHERRSYSQKSGFLAVILLFVALFAALGVYLALRARSGAVPISSYTLSLRVLSGNVLEYAGRTYGLLTLTAAALSTSLLLRGRSFGLRSLTKYDLLFSGMLFSVAIAPFVLLRSTPGIYSYLPGIGAALLLGAFACSLYAAPLRRPPRPAPMVLIPAVLIVGLHVALAVLFSLKWIHMAEVNTAVLQQISAQQPFVRPNTFILLRYAEIDHRNRFPAGFGSWSFPYALRVLYADKTVDGLITPQGESYSTGKSVSEIRFCYAGGDKPAVVKAGVRSLAAH